jgi:hypothetical protein
LYISNSGTRRSPIVYRSYRGRALLKWTGPAPAAGDSRAVVQFARGVHHVRVFRLRINGVNRASQGVKCDPGADHIVVRGNTIRNTGSAGVATKACDYITIKRNRISHTGYDPNVGWSSAVSLNSQVWSDRAAGFHSFVISNVISGASDESSFHSEGHGIIVDLGGDAPPVLVANNVVYENGGRCLTTYQARHVWFVNNTCYKNALDLRTTVTGEVCAHGSDSFDVHFINNVAFAWTSQPPYCLGDGARGTFSHNVEYGGSASQLPSSVLADSRKVRRTNPRFRNPPYVNPIQDQQQRTALPPSKLGNRLVQQRRSPLVNRGVDPRRLAGVTAALRLGMKRHLTMDIRGVARPASRRWDIGAYER